MNPTPESSAATNAATKKILTQPVYFGSSIALLVFVEVIPVLLLSSSQDSIDASHLCQVRPSLISCIVKSILQRWTLQANMEYLRQSINEKTTHNDDGYDDGIYIHWTDVTKPEQSNVASSKSSEKHSLAEAYLGMIQQTANSAVSGTGYAPSQCFVRLSTSSPDISHVPLVYLPSSNPTHLEDVPCVIRAYGVMGPINIAKQHAIVTESTLIRTLPPRLAYLNQDCIQNSLPPDWFGRQQFQQQLLDEVGSGRLHPGLQDEVIMNHNPETVQALALRMKLILEQNIYIGTTADALQQRRQQALRNRSIRRIVRKRGQSKDQEQDKNNLPTQSRIHDVPRNPLHWEASLLIHSPHKASGKTMLVQAVAAQKLNCPRIHLIAAPTLLAKYGIHADAALESILHSIVVSAAAAQERVCIILDHIDALLPGRLNGTTSNGDAATPIVTSVAAYLQRLTRNLQERREFPFPTKNRLYNVGGNHGTVLGVNLCIVAVVTCPDDGWRSQIMSRATSGNNKNGALAANSTILDVMVGGRYRIPDLSNSTRLKALSAALQRLHIELDEHTQNRLPKLAASASWMKGRSFEQVAKALKQRIAMKSLQNVRGENGIWHDLNIALRTIQDRSSDVLDVHFEAAEDDKDAVQENNKQSAAMFASVGGNVEAKRALHDALALDDGIVRALATFGMAPPTGILLYGPPGTGKTLLAKSVAVLLKSRGGNATDDALGGAFVSLRSSDIVQAEIGTSEKLVKAAFETARMNAPAVIFIDEFQALFTERSNGGSSKLASTLLQCMDDIQKWQSIGNLASSRSSENADQHGDHHSNRIVVLAATNTPWMVDGAFLRSGRFDRIVHVGLPTEEERCSILNVHMSKMKLRDRGHQDKVAQMCESVASKTNGFSGADLTALCRAAAIRCILLSGAEGEVDLEHFMEALVNDVQASSSRSLVRLLQDWHP